MAAWSSPRAASAPTSAPRSCSRSVPRVAAATLPTSGRIATKKRQALVVAAVIAAPIVALLALALIDLVSGGNAHLTRSVLDAGGAGNLADIAQRRLELSADDFAQAAGNPLFWIVMVGITVAATQWRRIDAWLRPAPAARAGRDRRLRRRRRGRPRQRLRGHLPDARRPRPGRCPGLRLGAGFAHDPQNTAHDP